MASLHDLHSVEGQSPWLDNLSRPWLTSGEISRWIDRGVRGITSNPSIFAAAMSAGDAYDEQLSRCFDEGQDIETAYWSLVVEDIICAADLLAPIHAASEGVDGRISVEVSPALARDRAATEAQARELVGRVDRPNLMIKVPATIEGLGAIRTLTAEGISVNVTLIFGLQRYREVMEAYIAGLEDAVTAGATDLSGTTSVASFFISRVDTEVDRRLEALGTPEALALRGTAAVTQGQLAYRAFRGVFAGPRWEALAARGARVQRPLWASTSTKNPAYPDTLYVDELIGPDTVNTMPEATLVAFEQGGTVARTVDADPEGTTDRWERLSALVDLDEVATELEHAGVEAFMTSLDEVLDVLKARTTSR